MGIDADDVENPDNLVINHETDDGWEQPDTTVEEVTDDRVRVSADVDGFSLFAVAEVAPAEDGGQLTRSRPARNQLKILMVDSALLDWLLCLY